MRSGVECSNLNDGSSIVCRELLSSMTLETMRSRNRTLLILGVLLLKNIASLFSEINDYSSSTAASIYHNPLDSVETAYYIMSEEEYVFFFPTRFHHPDLRHVCLLMHNSQNGLICQFGLPPIVFSYKGYYEGTVAASWQMMFANGSSSLDVINTRATIEKIVYSIVGLDKRPDLAIRAEYVGPSYATFAFKTLLMEYNVNVHDLHESLVLLASSHVNFKVEGILPGMEVPLNLNELRGLHEIEPATWFTTLVPTIDIVGKNGENDGRYFGYPNPGYRLYLM